MPLEVELADVPPAAGNEPHDYESLKTVPSAGRDSPTDATEAGEALGPADPEDDVAVFMKACQDGNLGVVERLVALGYPAMRLHDGVSGLHWAAINNRLGVVRYLLTNEHSRADANAAGGQMRATPLHWACRNGLVYIADFLLAHGADPALRDSQSYHALHLAVHSLNITLVVYVLLRAEEYGIHVDDADAIGCTPLHWAAYQGDVLSVRALLRFGADAGRVDQLLMTPLHWAFMRGYKLVLAALVHSDLRHKNSKGKDAADVAADMKCAATWAAVLREADIDPVTLAKRHHAVSPKAAKMATYAAPFAFMPLLFRVWSLGRGNWPAKLVAGALLVAAFLAALSRLVVPVYLNKDRALVKSPLLAGIFSATAACCIATYLLAILPALWPKHLLWHLLLIFVALVLVGTFVKTATINPGLVPVPADHKVVLEQVRALIALGQYDTEHFCFYSFVRKPLRSKYSRFSGRLVARFDHYCPWVYNDVGVRNHKLFVAFIYAMAAGIVLYTKLALAYFDKMAEVGGYELDVEDTCFIGHDWCKGFRRNPFVFNVLCFCLLQLVWLSTLIVVQTFQISKGLTTWEFSTLSEAPAGAMYNHSTVPDAAPVQPARHRGTCLKLLGLDQFFLTAELAVRSVLRRPANREAAPELVVPTDYGVRQNWRDFWFLGEEHWRNVLLLPIEGENNLNGQVVDYYKLYEYPRRYWEEPV